MNKIPLVTVVMQCLRNFATFYCNFPNFGKSKQLYSREVVFGMFIKVLSNPLINDQSTAICIYKCITLYSVRVKVQHRLRMPQCPSLSGGWWRPKSVWLLDYWRTVLLLFVSPSQGYLAMEASAYVQAANAWLWRDCQSATSGGTSLSIDQLW